MSFWEKEFNSSLNNHVKFLHDNIENQEAYNSKFSKLLQEMGIFESESDNEKQENQENEQNNENNSQNESKGEQEKNDEKESQNGLDGDFDFEDYSMNEQLVDTDSENKALKV